jgi:chorismate mutase
MPAFDKPVQDIGIVAGKVFSNFRSITAEEEDRSIHGIFQRPAQDQLAAGNGFIGESQMLRTEFGSSFHVVLNDFIKQEIVHIFLLKLQKNPDQAGQRFNFAEMTVKLNILPLSSWIPSGPLPLVIAGPCSAETEEQVMSTAVELAKIPQVRVFRSGIWKPRTRPSSFEGVGTVGLKWLQRVKKETGLLTTVEVASPQHVREALDYGVDILWIGARTVVNPFSVQEICDQLAGTDIPVMVKNPLNPDIRIWIGAIERLNQAGINRIIAVHRGFSFFNRTPFRNAPMWEIPIELKSWCPELPVIVDPSHICGDKELIFPTSQKALDLEMNGLMIETHIRPDEALTDREQQITPDQLRELLGMLVIREETGTVEFENRLEQLRSEIDKLDEEMIDILARRMMVVDEIGKYKKENNITILQLKRWSHVIHDRVDGGVRLGLSRDFILKLLEAIHEESIQRQTDVMNRKD